MSEKTDRYATALRRMNGRTTAPETVAPPPGTPPEVQGATVRYQEALEQVDPDTAEAVSSGLDLLATVVEAELAQRDAVRAQELADLRTEIARARASTGRHLPSLAAASWWSRVWRGLRALFA